MMWIIMIKQCCQMEVRVKRCFLNESEDENMKPKICIRFPHCSIFRCSDRDRVLENWREPTIFSRPEVEAQLSKLTKVDTSWLMLISLVSQSWQHVDWSWRKPSWKLLDPNIELKNRISAGVSSAAPKFISFVCLHHHHHHQYHHYCWYDTS